MDTFKSITGTPAVDPCKHVNYTYGMVLGVADFVQEFAYHSNRDQWMTRDIDGYGTVSGLRVTVEENGSGELEVLVTSGTAVTPRGQLICVTPAQCAGLNRWLAVERNREAVGAVVGDPPAPRVRLYVVLCYRDCPTDSVPVPGEPCRDEAEATAPSRLRDGFKLELRTTAPAQVEEDAARDFVRWLVDHVEFTDEPGEFTGEGDFLARLRAAAADEVSSPPDFMHDSPPDVMRLRAGRRCDHLAAAFRLWVTELRPRWRPAHFAGPCDCAGEPHAAHADDDDANCVLLAELSVPLTADLQADVAAGVEVIEDRRPVLLHQRMLQEWLLCGETAGASAAAAGVAPAAEPPDVLPLVTVERAGEGTYRLWFHLDASGNDAAIAPLTDDALTVFGETEQETESDAPEPTTDVGAETSPPSPADERPPGEVRERPVGGDRPPRVPRPLPAGDAGRPRVALPIRERLAERDRPEPRDEASITARPPLPGMIRAGERHAGEEGETPEAGGFLEKIKSEVSAVEGRRNHFVVRLDGEHAALRFVFRLDRMGVRRGDAVEPLPDYARRLNLRFVGQRRGTVTAFAQAAGTPDGGRPS